MAAYSTLLIGIALSGAIVGIAVAFGRSSRVLARSHDDALTDTLTGLGNRRRLLEDLSDLLASGEPGRSRLLLVLDLDGFKAYNDTFGHPAGDVLLARLGRELENAARDCGGTAYRPGGDEFCALIENRRAGRRRLRAAVGEALFTGVQHVTASYGEVVLPLEADSAERALQLADRRLYADKSQRRRQAEAREVRDALTEALNGRPAGNALGGVADLACRVGKALGLRGEELELVVRAAELHDVGKAAVPEAILENPDRLDEVEQALLRQHTLVGERILSSARPLGPVATIVRAGDERFDGSGHPDGLKGEDIPLAARIVAACDFFHTLTEPQPLGRGVSAEVALEELREEAGSRFDPAVVEALAPLTPASEPVAGEVA
ncbi:MAG TPA: HD domain-containing phosphohydrolase [Thermoleophilaceae bacterium]|nr:HD domain-containing phosphohydrolase [Thermoleophilaceae bacterium]